MEIKGDSFQTAGVKIKDSNGIYIMYDAALKVN